MLLSEYRALKVLERGPVPLGQVALHLGLTAATLTSLARGLQAHRWAKVERDPRDRRAWLLLATSVGLRELRSAQKDMRARMRALDHRMSAAARGELSRGLQKFLAVLLLTVPATEIPPLRRARKVPGR